MSEHTETWVVQGTDEIVIHAAPDHCWGILENSQLLPQWMPAVQHTDGQHESLGAVRRCSVNFEGRCGQVVEQCVVYEKPRRIGWLLLEDSLGFSKMLRHFTFDFVLTQSAPQKTHLIHTSYFEPRSWFSRVMVALLIRKKFKRIRQQVLLNIKRLAETGQV